MTDGLDLDTTFCKADLKDCSSIFTSLSYAGSEANIPQDSRYY